MQPTILSLHVKNRFGVLTKVTMLFGRRGCNIHSLAVDTTHDPNYSQITVAVYEPEDKVIQIFKQLQKLEDVLEVLLFQENGFIEREIALIKVKPNIDIANLKWDPEHLFVRVIPQPDSVNLIEAMGPADYVKKLITEIGQDNIDKLSRSGRVAMALGQSKI